MRSWPDLGLFSYLCVLFLIFIFIFIMIKRIISWIQIHLFFCLFFSAKRSVSGCCSAFAWLFDNFRLALLVKVLLIKKSTYFICKVNFKKSLYSRTSTYDAELLNLAKNLVFYKGWFSRFVYTISKKVDFSWLLKKQDFIYLTQITV